MTTGVEIAVIGMACRYPGARNVDEFWANLRDGKDCITHFGDEDLAEAGIPRELLDDPAYVKARGVLGDPALFDAEFFTVNPREAELMDPQHRYFLECAWEALEDSGYAAEHSAAVGVYAGAYENGYQANLFANPDVTESAGWLLTHLSSEKDYLATRVSYKLDLRGPSLTVQTACSTSLVAMHLAAQGLLSGACDLALAGGSTVRTRQVEGYRFEPEGILSPDGHTRAFDAAARGTVSSSGVGVVVLKRLEDALRDRDTIHAIVKGSAINNDGAAKVGFSAPSVLGQAGAIRAAQLMAEIDPETISYVEAHGSGTALGDPIEVEALTRAFRAGTDRTGFCAIGSVKTNIGHTHAASGAAGLIKTILALKHRQLPPSLHCASPNPDIDFPASPFYVNTALAEWAANGTPRRAGISSFGTGGTNAHVLLEEAPVRISASSSRPWQLVVLSGRTETALDAATDRLAVHLRDHPEQELADVAYTLQDGRRALGHRQALVCRDAADAAEALAVRDPRRLLRQAAAGDRPVAFMFSGLGDQYPQMARELYESEPVFHAELDRCADLFTPELGVDLRTVLYPERESHPGDAPTTGIDLRRMLNREQAAAGSADRFDRTLYAQPVMFMVEWALARLWLSWGVRPQAVIGYSVGEWVAACVADVLSLEDAVFLVARRAILIDRMPGGSMLAVSSPEDEAARLDDRLSVAAVNGPAMTVLAGVADAVAEVQERLTRDGVACLRLQTTHAFHSAMMESAWATFVELSAQVTMRPPRIPYISNVTGTWITAADVADPTYWARHMCQAVRFSSGVQELWRAPGRILLEVGPGQACGSLALQLLPADGDGGAGGRMVLASLPAVHDRQPATRFLLTSLGRLWLAGVEPDWAGVHAGEPRGRVPLPTYPFERQRYWIETGSCTPPARAQAEVSPDPMRKRSDVADWFSVPSWASTAPLAPVDADELAAAPHPWLLFVDDLGVGDRIASRLERAGHDVTTVVPGDRFESHGAGRFALTSDRRADYDELFRRLSARGAAPRVVVHLWTVMPGIADRPSVRGFTARHARSFASLLCLMQAWEARGDDDPLHLAVVSTGLRQVTGGELVDPEKATVVGPCLVAPQEHPGVTARSIDIDVPAQLDQVADRLVTELAARPGDPVVAYRGGSRWTPRWEPVRVDRATRRPARLRDGGVYLITGGLGGIGLALAGYLARTARARLVLVGRSALPERDEWARWLAAHDEHDETATRIRAVAALEEAGAQVLVVRADVADEEEMRAAVTEARQRFATVHGVIHAAGVPGGGLMQLKQPEAAARVLAPKAVGALVLDAVTRDLPLDFMLLCSSTIAFSGGLGQVDYCAANAFLDAFAQRRTAAGDPFTVSVNWDAWQEVGMAVKAIERGGADWSPRPRALDHALLHTCLVDTATHAVYAAEFTPAKDWLVDEHRMLGHAVVPGTAYLEMVRAAVADQGRGAAVRFDDVLFLAPAVVRDDQTKEIHVVMEKLDDGFRFSVASSAEPGRGVGPSWLEHVTGQVRPLLAADTGEPLDPADLIERHRLRDLGDLEHTGPMAFGPRSRCLERVWAGDGEALALLALPERFAGDLAQLGVHPFLLDVATGFASLYLERNYLMPLRYRTIQLPAGLPARVYSLLRYRDGQCPSGRETISFDVTILDEHGRQLAWAEDFVMKKARALETKLVALRDGVSDEVNTYAYPEVGAGGQDRNAFLAHLETGIEPAEGVDAFERLLARELAPQVVVATKDLDAIITHVGAVRPEQPGGQIVRAAKRTHARPNLGIPYVAPRNELEQTLAGLWRDQIGVEPVGIHDNFYDLGGHSLLGIQLLARLRDTLHVQVTLQSLFDNLTVSELARVVSARIPQGGSS